MAAPATDLVRIDPSDLGIRLDDGFSTKILIGANLSILLWDKSSQPPGVDGGDEIETTTMFNLEYRTFAPRRLKTLSPVELTCAYEPGVYAVNEIMAIINQNTTINVVFSDGSVLGFFGYLKVFTPQTVEEGSQPEANCTIVPTNWDPDNNVEAGPALANVTGT
jgi:hypothetical protein